MRAIVEYETIVHGVEHEQFFEGCGVSFTPYTDVATGIGVDASEAFDDGLEQLAMAGWDVESLSFDGDDVELPEDAHEELHVYVSVRVRACKRFELSIDMGNDMMSSPADAAGALRQAAMQIEAGNRRADVRDANGNRVGEWELT